jgi:hypothetical protein
MRRIVLTCLLVIAVLATIGVPPVLAQAQSDVRYCNLPKGQTSLRPGNGGPPTDVSLGLLLMDLREINDVDQTITVDIATRRTWYDPRLDGMEGCKFSIHDIWYPELILVNSGRIFERWDNVASVDIGGKVTYLQRLSGTFSSHHSLGDFPLDKQQFRLSIVPINGDVQNITTHNDEVFSGRSNVLNISDWQIGEVSIETNSQFIPALSATHEQIDMVINASRYSSYYFWKIVLPVALIVLMSWCAFWMDPSQFGAQVGLSATAVLTLIAFIFATTNMLPRLGYFTRLDFYVGGATILVFLGLVHSMLTGFLVSTGQSGRATRIKNVSSTLYLGVFVVFSVLVFLI